MVGIDFFATAPHGHKQFLEVLYDFLDHSLPSAGGTKTLVAAVDAKELHDLI